MTDSTGLAGETSALAERDDIKPSNRVCEVKRLLDHFGQNSTTEILIGGPIINQDRTRAGRDPDTSDGILSFAGAIVAIA